MRSGCARGAFWAALSRTRLAADNAPPPCYKSPVAAFPARAANNAPPSCYKSPVAAFPARAANNAPLTTRPPPHVHTCALLTRLLERAQLAPRPHARLREHPDCAHGKQGRDQGPQGQGQADHVPPQEEPTGEGRGRRESEAKAGERGEGESEAASVERTMHTHTTTTSGEERCAARNMLLKRASQNTFRSPTPFLSTLSFLCLSSIFNTRFARAVL